MKKPLFCALLAVVCLAQYTNCKKQDKAPENKTLSTTLSTGLRNWHTRQWSKTKRFDSIGHSTIVDSSDNLADVSDIYSIDTSQLPNFGSSRNDSIFSFGYYPDHNTSCGYINYLLNDSIYVYRTMSRIYYDGYFEYSQTTYMGRWTY